MRRGYAGASSNPKQNLVSLTPDSRLAMTVNTKENQPLAEAGTEKSVLNSSPKHRKPI